MNGSLRKFFDCNKKKILVLPYYFSYLGFNSKINNVSK